MAVFLPKKKFKKIIFSLFLHENISCGYSLEVPWLAKALHNIHKICFPGEMEKTTMWIHQQYCKLTVKRNDIAREITNRYKE